MDTNGGIVVIGGGTGLSTMLRGLKKHTDKITAIVTVMDDGGGSGALRSDLGILPPGDIRNCIVSLSNAEPFMKKLFSYRFPDGTLEGQSFGNLFLAALNGTTGSFYDAVVKMSDVLNISGRVLPVTVENVFLEAEFENGICVRGESKIAAAKKEQNSRIARIKIAPGKPRALRDAINAILQARLIVFGPGSLYTSIIPNLLVDGVVEAIRVSRAKKVYVCNVMTQEGETEGYTAFDHVKALFDHSCDKLFDICVVNNEDVPDYLAERYAKESAERIIVEEDLFEKAGIRLYAAPLLNTGGNLARHDPHKLARVLMEILGESDDFFGDS